MSCLSVVVVGATGGSPLPAWTGAEGGGGHAQHRGVHQNGTGVPAEDGH